MNLRFFNEDGSIGNLTAALMFSLIFSSVTIAYFITEMNIDAEIDSVAMPDSLKSYSSEQNFISGTYDLDTLAVSGSSDWSYQSGAGLVLTTAGTGDAYLYILNINKDANGIITNYYTINNTPLSDYSIVISGDAGISNNEIVVKSDGFHLPDYFLTGTASTDNAFFPYPNANKIKDVKITTTYKEGLRDCPLFDVCTYTKYPELSFTFNDQNFVVDYEDINTPEFRDDTILYGGISGAATGLSISNFKTDNIIAGTGVKPDALTQVASFITTLLGVLGWGLPESIFPPMLNILLIKTQEVALLACIVIIIRGGGI